MWSWEVDPSLAEDSLVKDISDTQICLEGLKANTVGLVDGKWGKSDKQHQQKEEVQEASVCLEPHSPFPSPAVLGLLPDGLSLRHQNGHKSDLALSKFPLFNPAFHSSL